METKIFLQPGEISSDYQFDPNLIDFNNSNPKLKENRPADLTTFAHFDDGIHLDYSRDGGVLTANGFGGIGVDQDELLLDVGRYVDYSGLNNADSLVQKGCLRFYWRPAYSGSPSATQYLFTSCKANGNFKNLIQLSHNQNGNLEFHVFDINQNIISFLAATFSPVAGTIYEIECNFDVDSGPGHAFQAMFIQGVLSDSDISTGTRDNEIGLIRVANAWPNGLANCTGSVHAFLLFDAVQHTEDYTPSLFKNYPTNSPSITGLNPVSAGKLIGFSFVADEPDGTFISWALLVNEILSWFDGSSWVPSSGPSESNIAITEEQLALLNLGGFADVAPVLFSNSDGNDTAEISSYELNYISYGFAKVTGYFLNADGSLPKDAEIIITPINITELFTANINIDITPMKFILLDKFGKWVAPELIVGVIYNIEFFAKIDGIKKFHGGYQKSIDQSGDLLFNAIPGERIIRL